MKTLMKILGFMLIMSISAIMCLNGLMSKNYFATLAGMGLVVIYLLFIFRGVFKRDK